MWKTRAPCPLKFGSTYKVICNAGDTKTMGIIRDKNAIGLILKHNIIR